MPENEAPSFEEWARRFWSAALYVRRAKDRDLTVAREHLYHISHKGPLAIADRAFTTIKEIDNEQPSSSDTD